MSYFKGQTPHIQFAATIPYHQERIKGTETASPIHTLFYR